MPDNNEVERVRQLPTMQRKPIPGSQPSSIEVLTQEQLAEYRNAVVGEPATDGHIARRDGNCVNDFHD